MRDIFTETNKKTNEQTNKQTNKTNQQTNKQQQQRPCWSEVRSIIYGTCWFPSNETP